LTNPYPSSNLQGVDTLKERLSEKLFSLWKAYDKDNSGELDSNEQDALFSALYESIHKKEKKKDKRVELLSRWKSFFDSDGNGTLSKDEFENGILFLRFADTVEKVVIVRLLLRTGSFYLGLVRGHIRCRPKNCAPLLPSPPRPCPRVPLPCIHALCS